MSSTLIAFEIDETVASYSNIRSKDNDFKIIEKTDEVIQEKLRNDELYPDLADQFVRRVDQVGAHRYFLDYKYLWGSMMDHREFIPIPEKLQQLLTEFETARFMGLLPEIDRAWISVDNKLYLWSYKNAEDYDVYDGFSEVITSVSLSTPRPGVFLESIKYVLVVATPLEVVLLAIAIDTRTNDNLRIIPTTYSISSDNVTMIKVCGSQCGRVFMAGSDSNLYELDYDNVESSWLSLVGFESKHKCRKLNRDKWHWRLVTGLPPLVRNFIGGNDSLVDLVVDNYRRVVYTISLKGYLSMYYLNNDNKENYSTHEIVFRYDLYEGIKKLLQSQLRNQDSSYVQYDSLKELSSTNSSVVGLYVIPIHESKKVHAVILLSTGIRVYISLVYESSAEYIQTPTPLGRPSNIEVHYLRCPPTLQAINCAKPKNALETGMESGCLPSYSSLQLLQLKKGYYCSGALLFTMSGDEGKDSSDKLCTFYPDLMARQFSSDTLVNGQSPSLREAVSFISSKDALDVIQGRVYDIKEKSVSLHNQESMKLQALIDLSATPSVSNSYQLEDSVLYQKSQLSSLAMVETLPTNIPIVLNPQNDELSWGFGNSTQDLSIIKSEMLSSQIPSLRRDIHRQFVCLTNYGVHVIQKLSPCDILLKILSQQVGSSTTLTISSASSKSNNISNDAMLNQVRSFFERYGAIQSCALCLGIACGIPTDASNSLDGRTSYSNYVTSGEVNADLAYRAISMMHRVLDITNSSINVKQPSSTAISNTGLDLDSRLIARTSTTNALEVSISPRLEGVYLLISRIVRPLWFKAIIKEDASGNAIIAPYVTTHLLDDIKTALVRLMNYFREYNPMAIRGDPATTTTNRNVNNKTRDNDELIDALYTAANQSHTHSSSGVENYPYDVNRQNVLRPHGNKPLSSSQALIMQQEDVLVNSIYRYLSRIVQAINLLLFLFDLQNDKGVKINWSNFKKWTLKAIVTNSNVHDEIGLLIREVLFNLSSCHSIGESQLLKSNQIASNPISFDYQQLADNFVNFLTQNCYHYYAIGDRYAYDATKEFELIQSIYESFYPSFGRNEDESRGTLYMQSQALRSKLTEHMRTCLRLWKSAISQWKSFKFIIPSVSPINLIVPKDVTSELMRICNTLRKFGDICLEGVVDICLHAAKNFYPLANDETLDHNTRLDLSHISTRNFEMIEHELYHGRQRLSLEQLEQIRVACFKCLISQIISAVKSIKPSITTNVIHENSTPIEIRSLESIVESMINHSINTCHDPLFHELLFDALLTNSPRHLIEATPCSYLENYLAIKDSDILYRHFCHHKEYIKAAILMVDQGSTTLSLHISKRVEFLRNAVHCASLAISYPKFEKISKYSKDGNKVHTISTAARLENYRDLLDVAEIQLLTLKRLEGNSEVKDSLVFHLMDLSTLFNDICRQSYQWDLCLLIMQTAKHDDIDLVARLWRSIIIRSLPSIARTDIGDFYLQTKRSLDNVDLDASCIIDSNVSFEEFELWSPRLSQMIVSSCNTLLSRVDQTNDSNRNQLDTSYLQLLVIIEEVEELMVTLQLCSITNTKQLPRDWLLVNCWSKLPSDVIGLDVILNIYMKLFDRWIGKSTDKILQLLSSSMFLFKYWIDKIFLLRSSDVLEYRQFMYAISSGRVQIWQDKFRRQINTLLGKPLILSSSFHMNGDTDSNLLDIVTIEFNEINQKISQLTLI